LHYDMWAESPPLILANLREGYFVNYAALASNTHSAESNVKDANYCQIRGRDETLSSTFSTARSGLVESLNVNAVQSFHTQTHIKGNAYVEGGVSGSRKRKSDGSVYKEKESKTSVDGHIRSREALRLIVSRANDLKKDLCHQEMKMKWMRLREDLSVKENQFVQKRCAIKKEKFVSEYGKNKPPNKLQKRAGNIDTMPIVQDKIPYQRLLKDRDTEQILQELRFRNLPTHGTWRDFLLKRLKEHEGDTKQFKPQCPDVNFDFIWELT